MDYCSINKVKIIQELESVQHDCQRMFYNFKILEKKALEKVFPFYRFSGSHYQIGQQYGSTCGELILKNLDLSINRLLAHTGVTRKQILAATLKYQPFLLRYAPFLDEEIRGLSSSTGLSLEEIYFLQLRAEIQDLFHNTQANNPRLECTSFAISGLGTANNVSLAGQNVDLPSFYADICIVVEIAAEDYPAVLMLTPAGQVSSIGMNRSSLCAFANYLVCDGWRDGFPRYCLTRLALIQDNVSAAEDLLLKVERASSRNILLMDSKDEILDLEFSVQRHGRLTSQNGRLIHSNHFISPDTRTEERSSPGELQNSRTRLTRLQNLIDSEFGAIDINRIQSFLRDRATYPHPVCVEPGDPGQGDEMTVASVIAAPACEQLWVAVGPPSQYSYRCYTFSS
jgi:isopenicillin-N N-acyltransferase-like protein